MVTVAILKSALPVEPPSQEMNSLFVIFNQKCCLHWGILTFKGSLLSAAIMLKRFFARNRLSPDLHGSKFGGFLDRRSPHSEFEGTKPSKGTCIHRNTSLKPLSVQFGPKLRPVAWPRKQKKKKKGGRKSHKNVIFHHHVEAPFPNRSALSLVSL